MKSRKMRWAGHVAHRGAKLNSYGVLVGKSEGMRPLGSPRRGWEDNIKMVFREVGWSGVGWINLVQDRD
jgi:hypothetical protein